MIIRRERTSDHAASRSVQAAAFRRGDGEPPEARLLDELRACDGWLPALSWVAQVDGRVVGHGVCTRAHVDDTACVALGPIGVVPAEQHAGIGSALVHVMIGAADASGEPLIALLGAPQFYSRFGFVCSIEHAITAPRPEWQDFFQVLPLTAWTDSIAGCFRYAAPFEHAG